MKILVPIENDMIYQHFGHTPALRLYDVEGNTVLHTKDYVPNGQGHVIMCQIAVEQMMQYLPILMVRLTIIQILQSIIAVVTIKH